MVLNTHETYNAYSKFSAVDSDGATYIRYTIVKRHSKRTPVTDSGLLSDRRHATTIIELYD